MSRIYTNYSDLDSLSKFLDGCPLTISKHERGLLVNINDVNRIKIKDAYLSLFKEGTSQCVQHHLEQWVKDSKTSDVTIDLRFMDKCVEDDWYGTNKPKNRLCDLSSMNFMVKIHESGIFEGNFLLQIANLNWLNGCYLKKVIIGWEFGL